MLSGALRPAEGQTGAGRGGPGDSRNTEQRKSPLTLGTLHKLVHLLGLSFPIYKGAIAVLYCPSMGSL